MATILIVEARFYDHLNDMLIAGAKGKLLDARRKRRPIPMVDTTLYVGWNAMFVSAYLEAARVLAQKALKDGGDKVESRIDFVAQRLLARPFRPEEKQVVQSCLNDMLTHYKGHVEDAKKVITVGESKSDASLDVSTLAAWTMLVNELMNLDEVLNK